MVQRYVNKYDSIQHLDVENLLSCTKNDSKPQLLQYLKDKFGASHTTVATQLELFGKAKNKLPGWVNAGCLFTRKSLEQCSSEALAGFKAGIVNGHTLVDLSGGLGVDDVAFSRQFTRVISVDSDEELNELVRYNFNRLAAENITRIGARAEDYIAEIKERVDVIYIDADRRPEDGKKIFTLSGSTPDVVALMPQLLEKSSRVMLKLSPMMDLKLLLNTFGSIRDVYVVGMRNEVKEILAVLYHEEGTPCIHAVEVDADGKPVHDFNSLEQSRETMPAQEEGQYFYEPSNMIIKAGLTVSYAGDTGARLVYKNSHYMVSDTLMADYFGRAFRVVHHTGFSKSAVKNYLKENRITKANVSARNFVTSVEEIRKTFTLEDGGDEYLFFTTDAAKNKLFWHCRKP